MAQLLPAVMDMVSNLDSGVYFWTRGGLDGEQPNRHVVNGFVDTRLSESLSSFTQMLGLICQRTSRRLETRLGARCTTLF